MDETDTGLSAWARARPYLTAALETCRSHTIDDVEAGILSEQFQFWPGQRCAVVTEIVDYPAGRFLNFWLLGGDLRALMAMRPAIEDWGRRQGCVRCGGSGRKTWGRVLRRHGYAETSIEFMKELA